MDGFERPQDGEGPPVRFKDVPPGEVPLMRTPSSRTTNSEGEHPQGATNTPLTRGESNLTRLEGEARSITQLLETAVRRRSAGITNPSNTEMLNLDIFDNSDDDVGPNDSVSNIGNRQNELHH